MRGIILRQDGQLSPRFSHCGYILTDLFENRKYGLGLIRVEVVRVVSFCRDFNTILCFSEDCNVMK